MRPREQGAFTIVELMVVIAVIALLIAITLPNLNRSRYEGRVTQCISNFHQWGIAAINYSNDYGGAALPRQDIPQTTGVNTWDVSNQFPLEMISYGVNVAGLWDCPVTPTFPSSIDSLDEVIAEFKAPYGYFSIVRYNWWVPRKFGSVFFPSIAADPTADPKGWPTHITSSNALTQPILSDRLYLGKVAGIPADPLSAGGGHRWSNRLESTSVVFTDGHAERRPVEQIKLRYQGNYYNFY
jgi:prepilin-type N-terminal cleavage/methylation domain-containing protein